MRGFALHTMTGYQTQQALVAVAGVDALLIRSLLNRQQFFDPFGEAEQLGISSAAWPLFGLLWPSGEQLAARMALRPVRLGERILEIGCGLALASLVGHRRGNDITASDCHPLAASFLLENLRLNHLAPMAYRHGHWQAPSTPHTPAPFAPPTPPRVEGRFDLVIGSDVLYERDDQGALANFIARHTKPTAEVWIVDPDRGNRAPFNRHMATLGFQLREERLDRAATATLAAYKGRLLTYCCTAS